MPVHLMALSEGPSFVLDKPVLLVGRDVECDLRLDCRKISRKHCCLAQLGERLVVRDLGSTNGVRVNGVRVVEGYLKDGDELAIGNCQFQVRWEEAPEGDPRRRGRPRDGATGRTAMVDANSPAESLDHPVPLAEPPSALAPGRKDRPHPFHPAGPNKAPVVNFEPDSAAAPPPLPYPLRDILPEQIDMASAGDGLPLPPHPPRLA
jgi:predicted component of type VI protein secretion system